MKDELSAELKVALLVAKLGSQLAVAMVDK